MNISLMLYYIYIYRLRECFSCGLCILGGLTQLVSQLDALYQPYLHDQVLANYLSLQQDSEEAFTQ